MLGERLGSLTLQEELKDGIILCRLVNAIEPGVCPKPSTARMAFKQMDNIGNYLKACADLGVPSEDTFQTISLYEGQVVIMIIVIFIIIVTITMIMTMIINFQTVPAHDGQVSVIAAAPRATVAVWPRHVACPHL